MSDPFTMDTTLHPFGSVTNCPVCAADLRRHPPDVEFSQYQVVANGRRFIPVHSNGDEWFPHLEKTCDCGYAWLESTAADSTAAFRPILSLDH